MGTGGFGLPGAGGSGFGLPGVDGLTSPAGMMPGFNGLAAPTGMPGVGLPSLSESAFPVAPSTPSMLP